MPGEPSEAAHADPHDAAHGTPNAISPLVNYPEAKTPAEWAVGTLIVLATVAVVVAIALSIAGVL